MGPGPVRQGWLPHGSGVGRIGRESNSRFCRPGQCCRHDRRELPLRGMVACFRPQYCVHSHFETRFSPGTLYLSDIQSLLRGAIGGTSGAYPSFGTAGAGQARCHSSTTRIGTRYTPDDTRIGLRPDTATRQVVVKWCLSSLEGGVGPDDSNEPRLGAGCCGRRGVGAGTGFRRIPAGRAAKGL
jgi:hypothetical protein